ncbi:hypothetical protein LTR37_000991 [Vermiconidia calcicola]|uniref:Uncharacterized protein n=1 Tax=Vermiconidia calcicola TaxID=1690605 RepID=A0ACC3NW76_9PEZI|nr:hypothetical protein LTR37_000991 [Vermiconidia calcicola]
MATGEALDTCNLNMPTRLTKSVDRMDNTACHKALNTLELLETVMLQLPCQDLLVSAQRVCKMWQATVSNSITLQRALCFIPVKGTRVGCEGTHLALTSGSISAADYLASCLEGAQLNPYLTRVFVGYGEEDDSPPHTTHRPIYVRADSEFASWKRMYITQPPVSRLHLCALTIWKTHETSESVFDEIIGLDDSSGIKMNHLLKSVEEQCLGDNARDDGYQSARLVLDRSTLWKWKCRSGLPGALASPI